MQGTESGLTNSELRVRVSRVQPVEPNDAERDDAERAFTFAAQQTVWIGRDASCDVVLNAQEVSRRHASLFVKEGELFVRDHSSYGMQVDGRPLSRAVRPLRPPNTLELGPYRLEVTLAGDALQLRVRPSARWSFLRDWRAWLGLVGLLAALAGWRFYARGPALGEGAQAAARAACPSPPTAAGAGEPTAARAVALLRSGDRLAALHAYRALAARDDSRAEFAIVAGVLARELSCRP